ncbi:MAG: AAA family ATPase [Saprospiraceae bacterium]
MSFADGPELTVPLMDMDSVRMGQPLHLVSGKYAETFQREVLNKGELLKLMEELHQHDFEHAELTVHLPAAEDGYSYPALDLTFQYWIQIKDYGFWGVIPALNIETFVKQKAQLADRLRTAVELNFTRRKLLNAVQNLVAALRLEQQELIKQEILLRIPTLSELEDTDNSPQEKMLPKVAQRLVLQSRVTYGREKELDQLERALKGEFTKNVLLVGTSGVGKTALVWEIAKQAKKRKITGAFWETTASVLIKELTTQAGWKDNISKLAAELKQSDDWLFVRNLQELFEVGQHVGSNVSVADYLRTFISRGEVRMVSECTPEEMAQIEVRNPSFLALFQIIRLTEPPAAELEQIIIQKVSQLAKVRRVEIDHATIDEVIRLNRRFTPYSGFPGKPIRFLESILLNKKEEQSKKKRAVTKVRKIERSEVIRYFCEDTGMPDFMIDPDIELNPAEIKKTFNQQVFGQAKAVDSLVDLLAAVKTGLTRAGKPIASLLFVGPTGVGKTELAKVLAQFMFGSRDRMLRFDMSEYSDFYSVQRLIGVGQGSDGLLTSAVRREPFTVLLFDEIEKADKSFNDLMLGVLGEGRLTDANGRTVNFCSTIIIMTSNIGAANLQANRVSFNRGVDAQEVEMHFTSAVEKAFRPELRNRIDKIVAFAPLSQAVMQQVVRREMELFRQREGMRFSRVSLQLGEEVLDYLAMKGYDPLYGARHLQRTMRRELIIPLAREINVADIDSYLNVTVEVVDNELVISAEEDEMDFDLLLEELEKEASAATAAELRRAIIRLQEGHFYIQLQNELNRLENLKRKSENKFWNHPNHARQYAYYRDTQEEITQLERSIKTHENELALAVMNMTTYRPEINDQIKQWRKDFFKLKLAIYTTLHPKSSMVHMGLYGTNIIELYQFYEAILEERAYQFGIHTIWHRKSYYDEMVEAVHFTDGEDGDLQETRTRTKREGYIKKSVAVADLKKLIPPKKNDKLVGIELTISGEAAYLFFQNEGGFQQWKMLDKVTDFYFVQVENNAFRTPTRIHRQEFYKKQNYRRTFTLDMVKDSQLGVSKRAIKWQEKTALLQDALKTDFTNRLEKEVV